MTVGIAAFGPGAGAAVVAGWNAAETGVTGDIGGFAVFTAILPQAGPLSVQCQRGGLTAVRAAWGDVLGLMLRAPVAAVITSGPDRAVPLSQFLAASHNGLVTGHRRPDRAGADGVPVNIAALRLLDAGATPDDAVRQVTDANPDIDAGLIAVTAKAVALADTALVMHRRDRGRALIRHPDRGLAVLHNSIQPQAGYAERIAQAGMTAFS
ncbi:DUF6963 family protein [Oceaniglobus indicus]|uniref:DUF6963 family protein n=1 Tax=Oceaniglobus indicus TaxID=2047749 RepID=UPI000C17602B|nr:hypothetical protein [Oceaniglobus indicus]